MINRLSPEDKELYYKLTTPEGRRRFLQVFFKKDFEAFVYLLGYRDLGAFHKGELNRIASCENPTIRRLWLWARGHFKTSLITEAHSAWLIVRNPDIRILIVSNTLDIAKKVLGNIRNHFTSNNDFRYFFREYCPKANKEGKIDFGTTEYFTIKNRTKALKEPTVMCAGIGTNLTGLHFDWMKIDDIVTKESVSNDTQIQASKDYYASLRQLFDNPTTPKEDVVGTPYHFNDLYADIRKHPEFVKSIIPAKVEDLVTFSERFSLEGLDKILNDPSVGPYQFNSQYMLNPVNPKDAKFQEKWWVEYDTLPEVAEYICVDPASTQKKKSDYTVIERWGVDWEGKHYLIEGFRDKLTSFQRIDLLFSVVKRCKNLKWVTYEVLGGRHGDLEVIKEKQAKDQCYFLIKETKSTTGSKQDRIEQRLVGVFNAGLIRFPRASTFKSLYDGKVYDFCQLYKLEFLQFPYTEHDDILDAHSQMFEEQLMKGSKPINIVEKRGLTADDWERKYAEIDKYKDKYGDQGMSRLRMDKIKHRIRVGR